MRLEEGEKVMSEEIKRNCNSCKFSFLNRCEVLKNNKEFQEIKNAKFDMLADFEFKNNFICDNYKSRFIEYPIEVSKISTNGNEGSYRNSEIGKFVKIAPCGVEYCGKTYLGLYLGDLPVGHSISHNSKTKELSISFSNNPAIFVFDLNKIVYGMESWWGIIESEEDLKEITESDVNNIWYVKALKELSNS